MKIAIIGLACVMGACGGADLTSSDGTSVTGEAEIISAPPLTVILNCILTFSATDAIQRQVSDHFPVIGTLLDDGEAYLSGGAKEVTETSRVQKTPAVPLYSADRDQIYQALYGAAVARAKHLLGYDEVHDVGVTALVCDVYAVIPPPTVGTR
jgi:hypothetical protein